MEYRDLHDYQERTTSDSTCPQSLRGLPEESILQIQRFYSQPSEDASSAILNSALNISWDCERVALRSSRLRCSGVIASNWASSICFSRGSGSMVRSCSCCMYRSAINWVRRSSAEFCLNCASTDWEINSLQSVSMKCLDIRALLESFIGKSSAAMIEKTHGVKVFTE